MTLLPSVYPVLKSTPPRVSYTITKKSWALTATLGRVPSSKSPFALQVTEVPSVVPTLYQRRSKACDLCTSSTTPESFSATAGVTPVSYLPCAGPHETLSPDTTPSVYQRSSKNCDLWTSMTRFAELIAQSGVTPLSYSVLPLQLTVAASV